MGTTKPPAPDLASALDRARVAGAKLGAVTDKLNRSLEEIETELANLNLGVTAKVRMEVVQFEHYDVIRNIRFGKFNQEWRLLYESGPEDDEENWSSGPLLNASREIRLLAIDHLPALIEELVRTAETEISTVTAKVNEVESLARLVKMGVPR